MSQKDIRELILLAELQQAWAKQDVFETVQQLDGDIARNVEGRETRRFVVGDGVYYRKLHTGTGWLEIVKNLVRLRLPVISARNEWVALQRLSEIGVRSLEPLGFGEKYWNPARRLSFLITRELSDTVQLDHYLADHKQQPLTYGQKQPLLKAVAEIARTIHLHGINHRDLYLCHFLLAKSSIPSWLNGEEPKLYLVDLHRAQMREQVPERWLVKDLASILFSATGLGVSLSDRCRFLQYYFKAPLRQTLSTQRRLLEKIQRRAEQLYQREQRLIARGLRG